MMVAPNSSSASCVRALMVAAVPTGMNAGASICPCGVVRSPRRAPVGSVFITSNEKSTYAVYQQPLLKLCERHFAQNPHGPQPVYGKERARRFNFLRTCSRKTNGYQRHRPYPEQFQRLAQRYEPLRRVVRQKRAKVAGQKMFRVHIAVRLNQENDNCQQAADD